MLRSCMAYKCGVFTMYADDELHYGVLCMLCNVFSVNLDIFVFAAVSIMIINHSKNEYSFDTSRLEN